MNYIKVAFWAIVAIVVIVLGLKGYHAIYKAGQQSIQVKWDANLADINKTADAAIAKAQKDRDAAIAANGAIHDEYETKLNSANAVATDFAIRLRDAYSAGGRSVSQAGHQPGSAQTSQPAGDDRLTGLLGRAAAECLQNSAQLDALAAEIKPQL